MYITICMFIYLYKIYSFCINEYVYTAEGGAVLHEMYSRLQMRTSNTQTCLHLRFTFYRN